MNKKILITGGTGFVGNALIRQLQENYSFINIGRSKNEKCENVYWNLKDSIENKFNSDIDTIIHSASIIGNSNYKSGDYLDVNVKSTIELLELCLREKINRFIYISSGSVYGFGQREFVETDLCNPSDMYGLTKYFSEKICEMYSDRIQIVILRLFFPYGNGQTKRLFYNLAYNIWKHKKVILNDGGLPIINPIHISDVVSIMKEIIEKDIYGTFNVCGNECVSIKDICDRIASAFNINDIEYCYNSNNVGKLIGCNGKLNSLLNSNYMVNLDNGIKEFVSSLNFN